MKYDSFVFTNQRFELSFHCSVVLVSRPPIVQFLVECPRAEGGKEHFSD